jgi:hypothetical protein
VSEERKLYARAGEWITCSSNGHQICRVLKNIYWGDPFDPSQLGDWQQMAAPKVGEPPPRCPVCKSAWYQGGGILHFADEWRH